MLNGLSTKGASDEAAIAAAMTRRICWRVIPRLLLFGMLRRRASASSSTGISSAEDDDVLNALLQNEAKLSTMPTAERADRRQRIAHQAADDGGDEGLQADQEAGVVVHGRDRRDQHAGDAGQQRRQQVGERAVRAGRMPTSRAPMRFTAVARSALPTSVSRRTGTAGR